MKKELLKKRKGFTLAELVIVMAIVAVLTGIAVAAFSQMTRGAQETTFRANHRTLVSAVVVAYANNNGTRPENLTAEVAASISDSENGTKQGLAALDGNPENATYSIDNATGVVTSTWTPQGGAPIILTYTP